MELNEFTWDENYNEWIQVGVKKLSLYAGLNVKSYKL